MTDARANGWIITAEEFAVSPGAPIQLMLRGAGLPPADSLASLSMDLFRIETRRNKLAFGFGVSPAQVGDELQIGQRLPEDLQPGVYVTSCVSLVSHDSAIPEIVNFPPLYFQVLAPGAKPLSREDLNSWLARVTRERKEYEDQHLRTQAAVSVGFRETFSVFVFGTGCVLHAEQHLGGFSLLPLGAGLSHRPMHDLVNSFLDRACGIAVPFDEGREERFAQSSPGLVVAYKFVEAVDFADAIYHCRRHAGLVFRVLGLDRDRQPEEFAAFAFKYGGVEYTASFRMPGARGNLAAPFDVSETGDAIERLVPLLQRSPFLTLLATTYADATSENNQGFALLRYWSVLELVADRMIAKGQAIMDEFGMPIFRAKQKQATTDSKHARVYAYVLAGGQYKSVGIDSHNGVEHRVVIGCDPDDPNVSPNTLVVSLWEMIKAAYSIRNAIAHEGQFSLEKAKAGDEYSQLAARLWAGSSDPVVFIREQAKMAFWREVGNEPA